MGIGGDNPWWVDVLAWGEASPFARFYDIDWTSADQTLRGKGLLPVLGDHYRAILAKGELALAFEADRGSFCIRYHDNRFPVAVRAYGGLLRRARPVPGGPEALDALIAEFETVRPDRRSIRRQAVIRQGAEALKGRQIGRAHV